MFLLLYVTIFSIFMDSSDIYQGVIQRKIADGGNRPVGCAAGQFLKKPLWGVSRLAKTASPNILPRGEFFHETQINFHQNLILIG